MARQSERSQILTQFESINVVTHVDLVSYIVDLLAQTIESSFKARLNHNTRQIRTLTHNMGVNTENGPFEPVCPKWGQIYEKWPMRWVTAPILIVPVHKSMVIELGYQFPTSDLRFQMLDTSHGGPNRQNRSRAAPVPQKQFKRVDGDVHRKGQKTGQPTGGVTHIDHQQSSANVCFAF